MQPRGEAEWLLGRVPGGLPCSGTQERGSRHELRVSTAWQSWMGGVGPEAPSPGQTLPSRAASLAWQQPPPSSEKARLSMGPTGKRTGPPCRTATPWEAGWVREVPGTTSQRQRLAFEVRTGKASQLGPGSVRSAQLDDPATLGKHYPPPCLSSASVGGCLARTGLGEHMRWSAHLPLLRQARR